MCGRINVADHEGLRALLAMMGMRVWPLSPPRFNVPPTASLDVVMMPAESATLQLKRMRWGFINHASGIQNKPLFNARSETVFSKPTFRSSALTQRAIVMVNGYYEWQRSGPKDNQAFHITADNQPGLFLAAIFQLSRSPTTTKPRIKEAAKTDESQQLTFMLDDEEPNDVKACIPKNSAPPKDSATGENGATLENDVCVLTKPASSSVSHIHHRMPVIVNAEDAVSWITHGDDSLLQSLIPEKNSNALKINPVSKFVNSVKNEGPDCLTL